MKDEEAEIVRWYTLARKFPTLIGRTPDGKRLPGGPYTQTQVIAAAALLFLGYRTMRLWAHLGVLGNYAVLLLGTWAAIWSLGKLPLGARSPVKIASGLGRAVLAPRTGRVGGRPVRIRRPHRARHSVSVRICPVIRTAGRAAPDAPLGARRQIVVGTSSRVAGRRAPGGFARRRLAGLAPRRPAGLARRLPAGLALRRPAAKTQPDGPQPLSGVQLLLAQAGPGSGGGR